MGDRPTSTYYERLYTQKPASYPFAEAVASRARAARPRRRAGWTRKRSSHLSRAKEKPRALATPWRQVRSSKVLLPLPRWETSHQTSPTEAFYLLARRCVVGSEWTMDVWLI